MLASQEAGFTRMALRGGSENKWPCISREYEYKGYDTIFEWYFEPWYHPYCSSQKC
jgi:hypothetical protein